MEFRLASYTYSKSIDDSSSFNLTGSASKPLAGENDLAQNPFDVNAERGRSLFDARQRFVLSYQWALPWWQQPKMVSTGPWQLAGQRYRDCDDGYSVYCFRREGFFGPGLGP